MTTRAPIRGVVRTAGHGQAIMRCVCQCGELLRPVTDGSGVRCIYTHCSPTGPRWYSKADIDAAMRAAEPSATQDAA